MNIFVVMHRTGEYEMEFRAPVAAFHERGEAEEFIRAQTPRREIAWTGHHPEMIWDAEDWYIEDPVELDPADRLPSS